MAINFLNDVSFNKNEIIQPVLENQINDTAAGTPVDGQLYYDTTNNVVKYGEGGSWEALATGGGTVTSVGITETGNALTITNSPISGSTGAIVGYTTAALLSENMTLFTESPRLLSIPYIQIAILFIVAIGVMLGGMKLLLRKVKKQNLIEIFRETT